MRVHYEGLSGELGLLALSPLRRVSSTDVDAPRLTSLYHGKKRYLTAFVVKGTLTQLQRYRRRDDEIERLAVKLAHRYRSVVLITDFAGLTKDGNPVYRPIARARALTQKTWKATPDPLSVEAFDSWVSQAARRLGIIADREATRLYGKAYDILDFDWIDATTERWNRAEVGLTAVFSNPSSAMIRAQQISLSKVLETVLGRTTSATIRLPELRPRIASTFTLRNPEISRALTRHHGFWVRDQYGRIAPSLSRDVRTIIANGIDRGLGRKEIARELEQRVTGGLQQRGYWETVSANAVSRSRSYSMGSSFRAAGITHYRIEAVIDEQTTETCMMLHGQLIPVDTAMRNLDRILVDDNPESVLWNQPFISQRGDDFLITYPDETETVIATRESPREGATPGVYNISLRGGELASAGVGFPPYHHRCRTTVIPEV